VVRPCEAALGLRQQVEAMREMENIPNCQKMASPVIAGIIATALMTLPATAQSQGVSDRIVKIGVLTDMTGVYADFAENLNHKFDDRQVF